MKKVLRKSNLVVGILILIVVCLGIVFASDGIVKQGVIEGVKFKSTGSTASGLNAVALGYETEATGLYSFSMGYQTIASGTGLSTAMGCWTEASAPCSTAMGYSTEASGLYSTAMGRDTTASEYYSTAMGRNTTASGTGSIATGYSTEASGYYSTAMGYETTAIGDYSTAMGYETTATGMYSTAMGYETMATGKYSTAIGYFTSAGGGPTPPPGDCITAIGKSFINDVQDSFAVGFGQKDFSVESGLVTVGEVNTNDANLYVTGWISGEDLIDRSSFYDKDTYGRALDYLVDSSNTIKLSAEGQKEYNHEADPEFVQRWITLKDYDKYTDEEVWIEELNETITRRIYETHKELGSSVTMKLSWLTQCVFELKQENQTLKDEIAEIKAAVGIE